MKMTPEQREREKERGKQELAVYSRYLDAVADGNFAEAEALRPAIAERWHALADMEFQIARDVYQLLSLGNLVDAKMRAERSIVEPVRSTLRELTSLPG